MKAKTLVKLSAVEGILRAVDRTLNEAALIADKHRIRQINDIISMNQKVIETILGLELLIENED